MPDLQIQAAIGSPFSDILSHKYYLHKYNLRPLDVPDIGCKIIACSSLYDFDLVYIFQLRRWAI